jgi:hypothetical protein
VLWFVEVVVDPLATAVRTVDIWSLVLSVEDAASALLAVVSDLGDLVADAEGAAAEVQPVCDSLTCATRRSPDGRQQAPRSVRCRCGPPVEPVP